MILYQSGAIISEAAISNQTPYYFQDEPANDSLVGELYTRAFGPGRFVKAAHFLRLGNVCDYGLSYIAKIDDKIIAACRMWHIKDASGNQAVFLGPIAVESQYRHLRIGQELMKLCLNACDASGVKIVLLVGDYSYFAQFGFEQVAANTILFPLPVMDGRVLWRRTDDEALLKGLIFPFPPPHH